MWLQQNTQKQSETRKRRFPNCVCSIWKADDTFIFLECKSSLDTADSSPMWENSNNSLKIYFIIIITFNVFSTRNSKLALICLRHFVSEWKRKLFMFCWTLSLRGYHDFCKYSSVQIYQLCMLIDFSPTWAGTGGNMWVQWNKSGVCLYIGTIISGEKKWAAGSFERIYVQPNFMHVYRKSLLFHSFMA